MSKVKLPKHDVLTNIPQGKHRLSTPVYNNLCSTAPRSTVLDRPIFRRHRSPLFTKRTLDTFNFYYYKND